jgi:peptidylprolyl isomerase
VTILGAVLLSIGAMAGALKMDDLVPCSGAEVAPGSKLTLHYEGWVEGDETPFDSTRKRGRPVTLPHGTGALVEGLEIGLQGVSEGCKRRIVIPSELAKDVASRWELPTDRPIVYEVEILSIEAGRWPRSAPRPAEGCEERPSGLRICDFAHGEGDPVVRGDKVTVEYTLWLADGTLVDSSLKKDGPFSYRAGRGEVIPGWEQAVLGMKVGGDRQFMVPWKLAYGRQGRPPRIPRKADLVFEVQLLARD